jgi:type VI secretion system protein ImpF
MSKPPQIDRVQPCLLDRLIDENPDSRVEAMGRGVSLARYRQGVLRDIEWLLNTKSRLAHEGLAEFGETESSVLNLGMPDPAGKIADASQMAQLEKDLEVALLRFEPRIVPDTLSVKAIRAAGDRSGSSPNILSFEISGELWASPINEQLHLKTEFDLETGQCRL